MGIFFEKLHHHCVCLHLLTRYLCLCQHHHGVWNFTPTELLANSKIVQCKDWFSCMIHNHTALWLITGMRRTLVCWFFVFDNLKNIWSTKRRAINHTPQAQQHLHAIALAHFMKPCTCTHQDMQHIRTQFHDLRWIHSLLQRSCSIDVSIITLLQQQYRIAVVGTETSLQP